jgi:hypothetical protein
MDEQHNLTGKTAHNATLVHLFGKPERDEGSISMLSKYYGLLQGLNATSKNFLFIASSFVLLHLEKGKR